MARRHLVSMRRHSSVWVIAHVVEFTLGSTSIVVTTSAATGSGHTFSRFRVLHRVRHYCLWSTLIMMSILILIRCGLGNGGGGNQLKRDCDAKHFNSLIVDLLFLGTAH